MAWQPWAIAAGIVTASVIVSALIVVLARRTDAAPPATEPEVAATPKPVETWPRLPGAAPWPPEWLAKETDHPYDLRAFFSPIPPEENAAPLYLEAFAEFDPEMVECFPPDQRPAIKERAEARSLEFQRLYDQETLQVRPEATPADIDRLMAEIDTIIDKLADAQRRPRCAFEIGQRFGDANPHFDAIRIVTDWIGVRLKRDLDRGEFRRPFRSIDIGLRLARDVQSRGTLMGQIMGVAVELKFRERVVDVLQARGLKVEHVDSAIDILQRHEGAMAPYPGSEGYKTEYVLGRTMLRDVEHKTGDCSPEGLRKSEKWLHRPITTFGEYTVAFRELFQSETDKISVPTAAEIDAEMARLGPHGFQRETRALTQFFRDRIAIFQRPYREQIVPYKPPESYYLSLFPKAMTERLPFVFARTQAHHRLTQCLAAVRRWQLTHQRPPTDLLAVVKAAGLDKVPADPFGDGPLKMATVNGEVVVYSVGADGKDDGGTVDWNNGEQPGDFILRLGNTDRR